MTIYDCIHQSKKGPPAWLVLDFYSLRLGHLPRKPMPPQQTIRSLEV
jgi:hypothetical protein